MSRAGPGERTTTAVALALCLVPLLASVPHLDAPLGQSEPSLNLAIWGLGARALVARGPLEAKLGAVVAPYPGRGDGIYAHHPPLPVWVAVPLAALGASPAAHRLFGVALGALSLWLLFRLLRREFDAQSALLGLAVAAVSGFALVDARLFTTVTLCTPLFLLLLTELFGEARQTWLIALLALLVWSSWDGALAALAAGAFLVATRRAYWSVAAVGAALASLLLYLGWANGGVGALVHQFGYRAANEGALHTLLRQLEYLCLGLGPLGFALLVATPLLGRQPRLWLSLAPGVSMLLLFRQGANHHAYWGHNLLVPLGFASALMFARWRPRRPVIALLLVAHAGSAGWLAHRELQRQARLDQMGSLVARLQRERPPGPLPMFDWHAYHPHVTWAAPELVPQVVTSAGELETPPPGWRADTPVLVHLGFLERLGCVFPGADGASRWVEAPLSKLQIACAGR